MDEISKALERSKQRVQNEREEMEKHIKIELDYLAKNIKQEWKNVENIWLSDINKYQKKRLWILILGLMIGLASLSSLVLSVQLHKKLSDPSQNLNLNPITTAGGVTYLHCKRIASLNDTNEQVCVLKENQTQR